MTGDSNIWTPGEGTQGPPGPQGPIGPTGPAIELNLTDTHIQWRVVGASTWINLITRNALLGPQGPIGNPGPTGLTGPTGAAGSTGATGAAGYSPKVYLEETAPDDGLGNEGDLWFWDKSATELLFYYHDEVSWVNPEINLVGAQGPTGATGPAGTNGQTGSIWYTGNGAPGSMLGIVPDFYLNFANGDFYEKTGVSTWTLRGNLRGPVSSVIAGFGISVDSTDPQMPIISAVQPVITIADADTDLLSTQQNGYLRFTNTAAKTLTVRDNATHAIAPNSRFKIRNAATSNLTLVEDTSVTINPPAGGSLVLAPDMSVTLIWIAEDEYDLIGQTEAP